MLFYHPHKIEESGQVCFNTDLVKIKVNIKKAENILKSAVTVLESDIPAPGEGGGFCRWAEEYKDPAV